MKYFLLLALISSAFAHEIKGTMMLEGTLKTKTTYKGVKAHCEVEVNKIRNLLEEDSHGNPAYKAWVEMEFKASDDKTKMKVNISKEHVMSNLFKVGDKTEVRDEEYISADGNFKLKIDGEGRVLSSTIIYNQDEIICVF